MDDIKSIPKPEKEVGLIDLLKDLWAAKRVIFLVSAAFSLAFVAIGMLIGKKYEATVVLSPTLEDSGSGHLGGLGALAGQYSGLASLAGISIGGGGNNAEATATLQSELITERYVRENDLLPILYAKDWDPVKKTWKVTDPEDMPTLWKAYRYFDKKIRKVEDDKKTGLSTLKVKWKDPVQAAKWANGLAKMTNDYLRQRAIDESERNIQFLNAEASKTNVIEIRNAIYAILQNEINEQMLAKGREEYALKIIDPAVAPELPSSFGVIALAALGFIAGGFAAALCLVGKRLLLET